MLSTEEFQQWCQRLTLSAPTQTVIARIRSSPPTRRVRSAAGNVSGRYASHKMGMTIQFESHRNELAGIYEMEHDRDVLEYYDQPPPLMLVYPAKSGRLLHVRHTPDYFVLRMGGAGWDEWKTEADLGRLAEQSPHRYVHGDDGHWCCPPGEHAAAGLGLVYRVRSSAEIAWIYQRNLLFLEDYLLPTRTAVSAAVTSTVRALVAAGPIALVDLLQGAAQATADEIYTLIATEQVFVDLHAIPLAEPERVRVFRDRETAQRGTGVDTAPPLLRSTAHPVPMTAGTPVTWDGCRWTIVNVGETVTALLATDGRIVEIPARTLQTLLAQGTLTGDVGASTVTLSTPAQARLQRASPADYAEANRRYQLVVAAETACPPASTAVPARTARHWKARYRAAEQGDGCGYVGLLPRTGDRGNRRRKLPSETLALMDEVIARDYETPTRRSMVIVYGTLLRTCAAQNVRAPSYKTFVRAVHRRPQHAQLVQRQGQRAAYAQEPFFWELEMTTPRHGDRPCEIGHIDHTELDIALVCAHTGRLLGRPWATFLTDAFSRRILAVCLSFDCPSYRACMLILRECVRRHARLPQTIVVDGGHEFASTYFETLLARFSCTKKTRPQAKPRFGSICERLFGATNSRFVHNLVGNTQNTVAVRQLTPAVDPRRQARWTLGALYDRLCDWAYEVYDTSPHPALGQTPRDAWIAGLAQSGTRSHRLIAYDEGFRLVTLPTTPKGTARVQPGRGVKINAVYYWCAAFRDPGVEKSAVPVRYDPSDAGTAYVFVHGQWTPCISEHYPRLRGRSEREMALASAELRRRQQAQRQHFSITAKHLADFLASVEAEELLLAQRLQDAAAKEVSLRGTGDATCLPSPPDPDSARDERRAAVVDRAEDAPPTGPLAAGRDMLDSYGEYR